MIKTDIGYFTVNTSGTSNAPPNDDTSLVVFSNVDSVIFYPDRMIAGVIYKTKLHRAMLLIRKNADGEILMWVERFED